MSYVISAVAYSALDMLQWRISALDMLRRNMAAVAFANSVRDACPACAWASGRRGRPQTDASLAFHLIHSIADRPLARSAPYVSASAANAFGAHGEFPVRGKGGRRIPAFSASGTGRNAIRAPGRRWIHHEAGIKAHRGARPPSRRTRRGSFPRSPRAAHREIFGENAFCP